MRIGRYWWMIVLLFVLIGLWYVVATKPVLFSPASFAYTSACTVKEDCYTAYGGLPECADYSCRKGQCLAIVEDACASLPGDPVSDSCTSALHSQKEDATCSTIEKRIGEQNKDYLCRVITCEVTSAQNAAYNCCAGNGPADVQLCETLQRVADTNKVLKIKACQ